LSQHARLDLELHSQQEVYERKKDCSSTDKGEKVKITVFTKKLMLKLRMFLCKLYYEKVHLKSLV